MSGCSCGCSTGTHKPEAQQENKTYVCIQCNTFKSAPADAPVPECCNKKMQEMD
ncbi:MAG: hypothetical protein K6T55_07230 [Syntrophobacterales bacterium]|nr:hypothetical protein [Syntrophobacterales bacterium]